MENTLNDIPVPPSSATDGAQSNEAWQKAQNALKKMGMQAQAQSSSGAQQPGFMPPWMTSVPPYGYTGYYQPGFPPMPYGFPSPSYGPPAGAMPPRPDVLPSSRLPQPRPYRQQQQPRSNFPRPPTTQVRSFRPVRFVSPGPRPNLSQNSNALSDRCPDNAKRYIERAHAAVHNDSDRSRLEEYLKQRMEPLIQSGAVFAVKWDTEKLPHEVDFKLPFSWTPSSTIKQQFQQQLSPQKKRGRWDEPAGSSKQPKVSPKNGHSQSSVKKRRSPSLSAGPDIMIVDNDEDLRKDKKKKNKEKKTKEKAAAYASKWQVATPANKKEQRAERFARDSRQRVDSRERVEYFVGAGQRYSIDDTPDNFVGTCMEVEKPYFRLTAMPDQSQVRPLRVLNQALNLVKTKYKHQPDYRYANDQLKSIRQDLMIQNIRTSFTVIVYEINARIALENKDREEFNQCQNQLKELYKEVPNCANRWEFTAYRLLYYIYMNDTLDINSLLGDLPREAKRDDCIRFGLRVWEAWTLENYVALFRLYANAPKMSVHVMDMFIERERKLFLGSILKAYKPTITVATVARWLKTSERELVEWLAQKEVKVEVGGVLDCRVHANAKL